PADELRLHGVIRRSTGVIPERDLRIAERAKRSKRGVRGNRRDVLQPTAWWDLVRVVIAQQVVAVVADVTDLNRRVAPHLMLDGRVPLPVVRCLLIDRPAGAWRAAGGRSEAATA